MHISENAEGGGASAAPIGSAPGMDRQTKPETLPPFPEPFGNPEPDRDRGVIGRNIVLFSDGTGNSSAKIQKTNVWRLYEALDLGYPVGSEGQCVQLAYYDNGVGTSAFRLLAVLGGVFGFGLARNIRDIYKFLCRNYREGDRIYAFGFSRGAYTIRLLVSLIAAVGIVENRSEKQLDRDARDMWREYRRGFHTNNFGTDLLVAIGRAFDRLWLRIGRIETWRHGFDLLLIFLKRRTAAPRGARYAACVCKSRRLPWWGREWWEYWRPQFHQWMPWLVRNVSPPPVLPECGVTIDFVGVWDTVAAYGGPMVEITRAIDEWIWPLTMPDYRLSEKVSIARHALAIDDKRDAFQPLLWDEVQEKPGDPKNLNHPRLQQVWFAGMHSDVGGGYDDETLAYVSLWWMVEHAQAAAGPVAEDADALRLRLLPEFEKRIESFRNVYGPIHNSRGGAGAFYRYQPRYLKAWLDWDSELDAGERADARRSDDDDHVAPATQVFRDPTIDRGRYRRHGLLKSPIRIHLSVEERLRTGTDRYAPNNLPVRYVVDDGVRGLHQPAAKNLPPLGLLDELGDRIKLRRFWYFICIVIASALVAKPIWPSLPLLNGLSGTIDARTDAQIVETVVNAFLPEFAERWTHALAADPWVTIGFLLALAGALAKGNAHEWRMTDVAALMWKHRFDDEGTAEPVASAPGPFRTLTAALRRSNLLQAVLAYWKWRIVPFVTGLLLWLALWYAALAAVTQLALVRLEQEPDLCRPEQTVAQIFPINRPCNDTGRWIDADKAYVIKIEMVDVAGQPISTWEDGPVSATPEGWSFPDSSAVAAQSASADTGHFGLSALEASSLFLRRVVTAPLMAPVLELRDKPRTGLLQWVLGDPVHVIRPELTRSNEAGEQNVWTGRFRTPQNRKGRLYFFVNDAVLPFDCAGEKGSCWSEPGRWRMLSIGGRYRNNSGYARVSIEPEPNPKM